MNKKLQKKNTFRIDDDKRELQVYEGNLENYKAVSEVLDILARSYSFTDGGKTSRTDIHYQYLTEEKLKLAADLLIEIGFTRIQ